MLPHYAAQQEVPQYISIFYNSYRLHSQDTKSQINMSGRLPHRARQNRQYNYFRIS